MNKPNIIFITCDQLRPFELGCYGGDKTNAPNIDKLAGESYIFNTACSPNPVCTPARSCMITGQYSRSCNGTLFNAAEPVEDRIICPDKTLPELLRDNNYSTTLIGKWHIHSRPETLGFDEAIYRKFNHLNENQHFFKDGERYIVEGNAAEYELGLAKDFLNRKHQKPFFLFYNISLPHMPYFDVEEKYLCKYDPNEIRLRPNAILSDNEEFNNTWFRIYLYDYLFYSNTSDDRYNKVPKDFNLKKLYALYKGVISAADYQVGRLVEMIDQANMREDTIIVFTADHGDNMGSHGLFNKDVSYDESVRIPMMYNYKKIKPTIDNNCVTSLIDIAPTLLDLIDIPVPDNMQGKSVKNTLINNDTIKSEMAFSEMTNGEISVRTVSHMFSIMTEWDKEDESIRKIVDEEYRFFDTRDDPYQMNNLAKSNQQRDTAQKLKAAVLDFHNNTPWFKKI